MGTQGAEEGHKPSSFVGDLSVAGRKLSQEPAFSLVAFDLDGTTINTVTRAMSPRVQTALQAARDDGARLAVVSGRPLHMLGDTLLQANWIDYFITDNGALIVDAKTRAHIFASEMTHELLSDLFSQLADLVPAWMACMEYTSYREKRGFTYLAGRANITLHGAKTLDEMISVLSDVHFVDSIPNILSEVQDPIYKLCCSFVDSATTDEAARRMKARGDLEVVIMSPLELEVSLHGANKGSAIDRICNLAGLDPLRSVCFGDSGNDITMVGHVGTFVAMSNAHADVLAVADDVCPSLADDGVAVWLEEHMSEAAM